MEKKFVKNDNQFVCDFCGFLTFVLVLENQLYRLFVPC